MIDLEVSDEFRQRAKVVIRRRFRNHRKALPAAGARARSEAIVTRVLAELEAFERPRVASFWPMLDRNEVDLRPVHAAVASRGGRVAYPVIDEGTMTFRWVKEPEAEMESTSMGYLAPTLDHPLADAIDVVLVPGIAFDPRGYRIGYGGGFYDRSLPVHCPPAAAWGVAFDIQLAGDIPNVAHDIAVDRIITDRRKLEATKG